MEIVKIKLAYTMVRFVSLRNAPARGAKIGAVIRVLWNYAGFQ